MTVRGGYVFNDLYLPLLLSTSQVKWGEKGATVMGEKLEKAKVLLYLNDPHRRSALKVIDTGFWHVHASI